MYKSWRSTRTWLTKIKMEWRVRGRCKETGFVEIGWRLPRIEVACLNRCQGPPRAVEPMMKMMMRGRRRNKRRKAKARVVTSKSTLNSLMKRICLQKHQVSLEFISEFKTTVLQETYTDMIVPRATISTVTSLLAGLGRDSLRKAFKSPPASSSRTMKCGCFSKQTPMKWTTFGWLNLLIISASMRKSFSAWRVDSSGRDWNKHFS